jgi:hypothetical protein
VAFTPVQKLSITSGAAMVLLSAVGLVSYLSTTQMVDAQGAAAVTNLNIARLDRVLVRTTGVEHVVRDYVEHGDSTSLAAIEAAQSDVEFALDSLRAASEDHPEQRRNVDELGPIVGAQFRDVRQLVFMRKKFGHDSAASHLKHDPNHANPTRLLAEMRSVEVRVLGDKSRVMIRSGKASQMFIVAGSLFAFLLALLALQPLRPSVERKLTEHLSQSVIAIPDDEPPTAP